MKNKKGFTLIELLAVIVIMAIIAIIVVPNVINILETSKEKSFDVKIKNIIQSAETQRQADILNGKYSDVFCSGLDDMCTDGERLDLHGDVDKYLVVFDKNKVTSVAVEDNNYCYINSVNPDSIDSGEFVFGGHISCSMTDGCTCGKNNVNLHKTVTEHDETIDSVNDMKNNTNLSNGEVVKTKGFYDVDDGGSAYYTITDENINDDEMSSFTLDNGLKAKLIINDSMSVKQFGAKGDGSSDDYEAFNKAITSGANSIFIPDGTYNINNTITANNYIKLNGNGPTKAIIKNMTLKTKYGISVTGIGFDGGANQHIDYVGTHDLDEDGKVTFMVTPNGKRDVIYKDCSFKNVKIASFARDENDIPSGSRLVNNTVENCTFSNIGKVAIYHSLSLDNATYINNTFDKMGSSDIVKGFVGALFIGDITNNTRKEAVNITIKNNIFSNLITKDDFSEDVHIINANFIAIKSDKAVISNNTVTNLIGYGHDREGIYTKVRDLTVTNNTLTNAGLGEGYICAKAHDGVVFNNISNNTLNGEYGCAIRSYGPGNIIGNTINITNTKNAITNTLSNIITTDNRGVTISNNTFTSGTTSSITVNGTAIDSYSSNILIRVAAVPIPIVIENNNINTSTKFNNYIAIGNPGNSIIVRNNKFNLSDKSGTGIYIYDNKDGRDKALNNNTIIEKNYFNVGDGFKTARTSLNQNDGVSSSRTISFLNNEIIYNGSSTLKLLVSESTSTNNDKLIVKGNSSNTSKSKTTINSQLKYFEIDNPNFATVTLTNN